MLSFNLLVIFTIKSNDSVSFLFLFPCFRFLHQGSNSFFSITGNCCVFELSVLFVYLFHYVIATKFELQPVQCTAYTVDSLNVQLELQSKRVKQFCQLFCIM